MRLPLTLAQIADICASTVSPEAAQRAITNFVIDSRLAQPGSFFVPIVGERNGQDFIEDAKTRGAVGWFTTHPTTQAGAIVVSDPESSLRAVAEFSRASISGHVIGITGSVGKTTVKDLTASILAGTNTYANTGSMNNELGLPLTLANAYGSNNVVLEMGARHRGDIAELAKLAQPTIGVVTRVGHAHLRDFGSIDAVADTKAELVRAIGPDGLVILNADDERVRAMADQTSATVKLCGENQVIRAEEQRLDARGCARFLAIVGADAVEVKLPLPGYAMVTNALLAIAAGTTLGVDLFECAQRLETATISPRRFERFQLANGVEVINDCYNANPTSMTEALQVLNHQQGPKLAILGEMAELGDDSANQHEQIRQLAEQLSIEVLSCETALYGPQHSIQAAVKVVENFPANGHVLIKASLVSALERVVTGLLDAIGIADATD